MEDQHKIYDYLIKKSDKPVLYTCVVCRILLLNLQEYFGKELQLCYRCYENYKRKI